MLKPKKGGNNDIATRNRQGLRRAKTEQTCYKLTLNSLKVKCPVDLCLV